jgi:hypothetical protein
MARLETTIPFQTSLNPSLSQVMSNHLTRKSDPPSRLMKFNVFACIVEELEDDDKASDEYP